MVLPLTNMLFAPQTRFSTVRRVAPGSERVAFVRPFSGVPGRSATEAVPCRSRVVAFAKAKKGGKGGDEGPPKKTKPEKAVKGKASAPIDLENVERDVAKETEDKMAKCLEAVQTNFNTLRTGRANPGMLDRIFVEQEGGPPVPLKNIASISVPEASCLLITPFDAKGTLKKIEMALTLSDLGINPSNDGEKIRLNIPQLTQDRRAELAKSASKFGEDGKVALRNVRADVKKKVDKMDLGKDIKKNVEDKVQKVMDANMKKVEEMVKAKEQEVLKL